MAIVKHRSSKNARYEDVLEYYTCKHREDTVGPGTMNLFWMPTVCCSRGITAPSCT